MISTITRPRLASDSESLA